jgi:hypothetical protein
VITGNLQYGFRLGYNNGTTVLRNSIITNNETGLLAQSGSTLDSDFNDVYNNETDYNGVTPGANDISGVPGFVAPPGDWHLYDGAITVGTGQGGADMGYYPNGPTTPLGGTTYYVRTDGNNGNSGTANDAGNAWLTIGRATGTLKAGDVLVVTTGTYIESVYFAVAGGRGRDDSGDRGLRARAGLCPGRGH